MFEGGAEAAMNLFVSLFGAALALGDEEMSLRYIHRRTQTGTRGPPIMAAMDYCDPVVHTWTTWTYKLVKAA
jgi:hypothetical protein